MMKILIVNNRYFPSTGPERYLFAVTALLEQHGHTVVPLAVAWDENTPTPYASYFVPPPFDGQSVFFRQYRDRLTLAGQWKMYRRAAYCAEARDAAARIIADEHIDAMYVLHTVNMLSPSAIDAAARAKIPVVLRLSDFNLLCPAYIFLRDGHICTECLHGLHHAVQHRCLQHSTGVTAARVLAMIEHNWRGVYRHVGAFIAPSRLLAQMLQEHFAPARDKIYHVPSFIEAPPLGPDRAPGTYLLYFGRVAPDKGLDWLIEAHAKLSPMVPLIIAGAGDEAEEARLRAMLSPEQRAGDTVRFVGFKRGAELEALIDGSIATVTPSRCLDNAPMSVYESLARGKPVVGSDLGGISDQITPECGFLVPPGDVATLRARLQQMIDEPALVRRLGEGARRRAETEFSPQAHYQRLMAAFAAAGCAEAA
jgi:glycosyltransferase involved in cell wall biosynthesis